VPATKNAASKTIQIGILHDKNHLYRIVLVHLTSNVVFKTRKNFQMAGYWILKKIVNVQNFVSLSDHICKPRYQTKHRTAAILWHNNIFTSEMCLLGFRACMLLLNAKVEIFSLSYSVCCNAIISCFSTLLILS